LSTLPKYRGDKFQCPHCNVTAQQTWFDEDSASDAANKIIDHMFFDYRTRIQNYQQEAIAEFLDRLRAANQKHMSEFVPRDFSVATCLSNVDAVEKPFSNPISNKKMAQV
jgi:hypothetical protein